MSRSGEIPPYRTLNSSRARGKEISRRDVLKVASILTSGVLAGFLLDRIDPVGKGIKAVAEWAKEGPSDAQKEGADLFVRIKRDHPEDILRGVIVTGEKDEKGNLVRAKARNKPWVAGYHRDDPRQGKVKEELDEGYVIAESLAVQGNNPDPRYDRGTWLLWSIDPNRIVPENIRYTYEGDVDTAGQLSKVEPFPLASVKLRS